MIRQPMHRRSIRARQVLTAASVATLVAVAGCDILPNGLGLGDGGMGWDCSQGCEVAPWVIPYSANILRGDTVRFIACNDYTKCGKPADTGTVVSKWTVPDSNMVTLANGTSATLVPAATHVLVRGVAAGRVKLGVAFSKGSNPNATWVPTQEVRVADSSEIKSIELPMYGYSDTVRVNTIRSFGVQLRDVGGVIFRGAPTSITSSDTTILKVTKVPAYQGTFELRVVPLKAGKASVTATFLGITATRQLTVVP